VNRLAPLASTLGLVVALAAGVALALAGPGHRFGLWDFGTGFAILRYAVYGGIAGAVISAVGLVLAGFRGRRRGMFRALAGLAIGLIVVGVPARWLQVARSVPPIHDVTTDPGDPPEFEAVLPLRADAPNPATYGGAQVAAQQAAGYPEIAPLEAPVPPQRAFDAALATATEMGWQIVAAEPDTGRIEATDRTFWFGFTDDVVVRIRAADGGSRIDVRSTSRVGVGDMGTNAARVRAYLAELREQLG
jgi:uncharacterized protein (DUF1499 family)